MPAKQSILRSTLGKKILMSLSGLLMVFFLVEHLAGNLLLLLPDSGPFNLYAHRLISLGWPIIAAEAVLAGILAVHVVAAISVSRLNRRSRPHRYARRASAGEPSRKTIASTSMIWSGAMLGVFLAIHLKTFKFGHYYVVEHDGEQIRDLYRLVFETFRSPWYAFGYAGAMVLLGLHLRHGFWSAFQSLGANNPGFDRFITWLGYLIAAVLALGFVGIPLWIYVLGVTS